MIEGTLAIISLLALIVIACYKIYSASTQNRVLPPIWTFITFAGGFMFWLLLFMSLNAMVLNSDTITTPSAQVFTVESENYAMYSMFLNFSYLLLSLITLFTIIEIIFMIANQAQQRQINPLMTRGAWNGRR